MYVVMINGKKHGPYNAGQIQAFKQEGKIQKFNAKVYKVREEVPKVHAEPVLQNSAVVAVVADHLSNQITTEATSKKYSPAKVIAWVGIVFSCFLFTSSLMAVTSVPALFAAQVVALSVLPLLGCVVWLDSIQVTRVAETH